MFGQEKDEFRSRTVSTFFDENCSNQLYINISVVGILYIYISRVIQSPIYLYSIWCDPSILLGFELAVFL